MEKIRRNIVFSLILATLRGLLPTESIYAIGKKIRSNTTSRLIPVDLSEIYELYGSDILLPQGFCLGYNR
jgi:hypothetical protein